MPIMTAEEFAAKHATRLKASLEDIRKGIARVTVAPGQSAVKRQDKLLNNFTTRVQDGTWAKRTAKVSLSDWQDKAANVGVNRIPGGIDAATAKVTDFARQLLPAVQAAQTKVNAMPGVTLEDSINRMTSYIREMAKFRKV